MAQGNSFRDIALTGAFVGAAATGALAVVSLLIGFALGNSGFVYMATAALAFLLPISAGLLRGKDFDPFEPINLVALAFLFGTTVRGLWLLTSDSSRVDFIMMGTSMEQVAANSPLMLGSVLCLVLGYVIFPYRLRLERFEAIRNYSISAPRLKFVLLLVTGLALVGIPIMISAYGISFTGGLLSASTKRLVQYVNENGEMVYGAGYQRWLSSASQYGFVLLASIVLAGILRLRLPIIVALAVMGALAMVTPFLTSTRALLLLPALHLVIVAFYYRRLTMRTVLVVAGVAFPLVAFLGVVREFNQTGANTELTAVDRVLGSGNSIDLVRTSAIMDRVPEVVDFQYGKTYAAILAVGIPRAVWPDKPLIGLGGFVKGKIFGKTIRMGGWPSGLIAEGWLNFGFWGLFVPLFMFGALLRFVYESVRPHLGVSLPITLIYAVTTWRLSFGTIGLNFSHGIADTLTQVVPVAIILMIARQPSRKPAPSYAYSH